MKLITENLIIKDLTINSKEKLFNKIAELLLKEKLVTSKQEIIDDLAKREKQGSTAFEYGLVIPHARSGSIKQTTLVIVEFAKSDFNSIDGEKSDFGVAIIVPKKLASEHMQVLSRISSLLSTKEKLTSFRNLPVKEKVLLLNNLKNKTNQSKTINNEQFDFVAITSCAAGIAHTYMARDALLEGAKKLKLKVKIETRGASTENRLTAHEIDQAKFVIIAADVAIAKTPFLGKKIFETSTNEAIKNAVKVIKEAEKQEITYGKGGKIGKLKMGETSNQNLLVKSIMSALGFMIPIAIVGGLLMAIPNAIASGGNAKTGGTWHFPNSFVEALWEFGHLGLVLMVPILAMFLAYRIGGKPAMPAALIGGYFINDGALMGKFSLFDLPDDVAGSASAGFLGGLVVGISVGYLVRWMRWIKWHPVVAPISGLMITPLVSSLVTFLMVVYVYGSPMTWIMAQLYNGLSKINSAGIWTSMLIGMLFAALIAIDLGGPINKTALTVATIIFADTLAQGDTNFVPQTAVQSAISVPPLGMWVATLIFRKRFSNTEKAAGAAALPMGLVGITEGALPFAFKTPLKAILANVSGSMVAGGLVSLFSIKFYGGLGSPLGAYIGYAEHDFFGLLWMLSIFTGAIVTGIFFGFLTKKNVENEKNYQIKKQAKLKAYQAQGLNTKMAVFHHHSSNFFKTFPTKAKYMFNPKNWVQKPSDWNQEEL